MIPNDIFDTLIGSLAIAAVKATHVTDGDEQTRQLIRIREARDWLNQLLVTVPVDATIETLHQSCDELQMQLDSEKVNTEYTEQLYEQALQRIDELEAKLSDAQSAAQQQPDLIWRTNATEVEFSPGIITFQNGPEVEGLSSGKYAVCLTLRRVWPWDKAQPTKPTDGQAEQ